MSSASLLQVLRAYFISLAHPPLHVCIEIGFGVYTEPMPDEVSGKLLSFVEPGITVESRQCEGAHEMGLAGVAAAEADSNLKHDARLLRNDRHRSAFSDHLFEPAKELDDVRLAASKQLFESEL